MNEENNWKEFSDDISNISKKIKSSITDEENIEDLKNSLKATKESISNNFNDLAQIVENTVKDEDIKDDALNLVNNLKHEMSNIIDTAKEKVSEALKIIISDKNVKGILINIFGGIMKCDVLAQGVVDAAKEVKINVPLVVRLAGTNFEKGKDILDKSGLKIISATDLNSAAEKIVNEIK